MKTKLWGTAVATAFMLTTFAACNNESKRAKAGEAVEDAREELEETRANGDALEARTKKAEYDSAKADYEKMNNPAKQDTTQD